MGGQTYVGREVDAQRAASFIDLIYETKDGHMSVAVMSDAQWAALAQAVEKPEWLDDPRFKTMALRDLNIDDRLALTQSVLATRTTAEWLALLEPAGVPCAPVLTRKEVVRHPQTLANDVLVEYDHPVAGRLRQTRTAARFERTPAAHRFGAPTLGQHTDEILREAGLADADIAALRAGGIVGG
jgi:crotonobetainyl-CoA:carnitine CoA-transferase CaiB-like acyl-CoA transferase